MQRRHLIAAIAGLGATVAASGALASGSVQATANATLTVLSPTTLSKTQDMVFGQIVRPSSGSNTVTLDTSDTVTISGAGNGSVVASTTSSAKFNVVSAAATTFTTTQTQAGLTNIAPSAPVATSGTLGTISGANGGSQEIRYGGQFDITAATAAQNYTGTLTVTVNYN